MNVTHPDFIEPPDHHEVVVYDKDLDTLLILVGRPCRHPRHPRLEEEETIDETLEDAA